DDPVVAGLDHRLEVAIGEDFPRQVAAGAGDARVGRHAACSVVGAAAAGPATGARRAISSPMRSLRPWLASASARSGAKRNARRSAEPWLFTTMPRSPRSAAPL